MKNLVKIIPALLFVSLINQSMAQEVSANTIFNHSNRHALDTNQTDIYNIITSQDPVLKPRIVILKDKEILTKNSEVELNIDIEQSIKAMSRKIKHQNEQHWTWFGDIYDGKYKDGYTFITVNLGNLSGVIHTTEHRYLIVPLGDNKGILYEVDPEMIEYENYCSLGVSNTEANYDFEDSIQSEITNLQKPMSNTIYHALVCYTPNARINQGGTNAMISFIDDRMNETNDIYEDSGVSVEVEVVYTYEVSGNETNNTLTNVQWLMDPNDDHWDDVHTVRNNWGADVVVLITQQSGGNCGSVNGDECIGATSSEAFAVMRRISECNYTFAHEIGHLFGARHDLQDDSKPTPYEDGHGYVTNYRQTVMSIRQDKFKIWYFSNPNVSWNDTTLGTWDYENVAHVHTLRANAVKNFKSPNFQVSISGPSHLDHNEYGTYYAYPDGATSYQWYKKIGSGSWGGAGSGQFITTMMSSEDFTLKCVVTKYGIQRENTKVVYYDPSGKISEPENKLPISVNYPNPFNPSTNISYSVSDLSDVSVIIYNINGEEVINWDFQNVNPGTKQIYWSGLDQNNDQISAGTYLYTVTVTSKSTGKSITSTNKMLLLK